MITRRAEPRAGIVTSSFVTATVANLVFFVSVTSFFSLPVHLEALGASRAEVGRIMGSFGIASLVGIPLTGELADRFGRRRFMLGGAVVWACAALGFLLVDRVGPLTYALRLGQGLAFSLAFVATNAVIVDIAPAGSLGRAIAWFGATTLISHALGPSFGEWVAERYGFARLFELSALFALAAVPLYLLLPEPERGAAPGRARVESSLRQLAWRRGARGALSCALGTAITFGAALNFMPVFVRSRGIASHAPFFVSYVACAIVVRVFLGGLGDRVGHRRIGLLGAVGFCLSAFGFVGVTSRTSLVGLALLFGLSHGLAYPSMNAAFVEATPAKARGRAMALFNLAFNIGVTLSAFVAGEVAERFGYSNMWVLTGLGSLAGTLAFALDDKPVSPAEG